MKKDTVDILLFVYNADGNLFAEIKGMVHKVISPDTYGCQLCKVAYDMSGPKDEWVAFLDTVPYKTEFLHRDEFREKYENNKTVDLPAVFIVQNNKLTQILTGDGLRKCKTLQSLIETLNDKLNF